MPIPLLIFLTAFIFRYFHIAGSQTSQDFYSYFWLVDSSPYLAYAAKILHGEAFLPWQSPLLSYFLANLYLLTGVDHLMGKMLLAIIGSLACVLIYLLGKELFNDRRIAIVAGFLSAASFGLVMATGAYNSEVIHGTLLVAVIFLSLRLAREKSVYLAVTIGFLSGLALCNRGEYALFLPLLLLWFIFTLGKRRGLLVSGIILMVSAITLSPNIYRNYEFFHTANQAMGKKVFPELYLLAPYSQFIFAQSNSPLNPVRSSGRYYGSNQGSEDWRIRIFDNPLHRRLFLEGRRLGRDYILSDVPGFLNTAWLRTKVLLEVFTLGFLENNFPGGLAGRNGKADCFTPDNKILLVFQFPLFLLGLWTAFKHNWKPHLLIGAGFVTTWVASTFYFGLTRYGIYLLPLIFLYVATGIIFIWDRMLIAIPGRRQDLRTGRTDKMNSLAIALATVLILVGWRQTVDVQPAKVFFLDAVQSIRASKAGEAIERFESGFDLIREKNNIIRDEMTLARFSFKLAELYNQKNELQKTLEELRRTLRYDPWHPGALLNSGILYDRMGERHLSVMAYKQLAKGYPNHPQLTEVKERLNVLTQTGLGKITGNSLLLIWGPDL